MPENQNDLIPWVSVVRIDGEVHVLKHMSARNRKITERNVRMVHPDLQVPENILTLEPCDPKDSMGHIRRLKEHVESLPDHQELTPERLSESRRAAIERANGGGAAAADGEPQDAGTEAAAEDPAAPPHA